MKTKSNIDKTVKEISKKLDEEELVTQSIEHSDLYKQIKELVDSGVLDNDSDKSNSGLCSSEILGKLKKNSGFMTKDNNLIPKKIGKLQKRQELQEKEENTDESEEIFVEPIEELKEIDTLTFDVPLFLRMLEYAKEDAKSDLDLHFVTENCLLLSKECDVLTMSDYDDIVDIGQQDEDNPELDDEYSDDEDVEIVQLAEKKKKKKNRKRMLRRGYGYIWPLYPMGPFFPPGPRPPKPPTPPPPPEEVNSEPEVTVSPVAGDGGSSSSVGNTGSVSSGAVADAGAVGVSGGDAGGAGGMAAGGGAGAGGAGGGAVAEAEAEDDNTLMPISRETKNQISSMTKPEIERFISKTYSKVLGNPRDVSKGKFQDKVNALEIYCAPDQTAFIKFKNEADGKTWIVHAELDKDMKKFTVSENWDLKEHVFSNKEELTDKFDFEKVTKVWPPQSKE